MVMSLSTRYPRGTSPLTTLSLSGTSTFPKAFPPKAYPHLTSLSLNDCSPYRDSGDDCDAIAQLMRSVRPRLIRLFTTAASYHVVVDRVSFLASLQALAMQAPDLKTLAIPDLPATGSVRYLFLQRVPMVNVSLLEEVEAVHQTWIKHALRLAELLDTADPSLQHLRAVRLPGKPSVDAVHAREVGEVKARLVQLEEQRMIKIVWCEERLDSEHEFARFVEEMER